METCPNYDVVGLLTHFASVVGMVVATIIWKHLRGVASDLKDVREQNSGIASPAGEALEQCSKPTS